MNQPLSFEQTRQRHAVIIDTRPSALYNGWPCPAGGTSGHEPGAINLAACWLDNMRDEAIRAWGTAHGLTTDRPAALYGAPAETEQVRQRLWQMGLNARFTLSDALTVPSRLVALPGYQQWVSSQWVADLVKGKSVPAAPAGKWQILDITCGETACAPATLAIEELESGPLFNVVPAPQLASTLARCGIRFDTTVILHSRNPLAAARAAHIMLYAGVRDVRLLDGGRLSFDTHPLPAAPAQAHFGLPVPAAPELMIDRVQAQRMLNRPDASLVSVRSWQEYSGQTSGYAYIHATGDIPGARWGHAGEGKNGMEDYLNPDGTVRSAQDIAAMWHACNITPEQDVAFYCGTGWRASLAFMCARAMGWPHIAVYDGGWYEWSQINNSGAKC